MQRDVESVERHIHNIFSLLGELGGFQGLLTSISVFFLSIFNYQKLENYIVTDLFQREANDEHSANVDPKS